MPGLFENTVSALCYDIARAQSFQSPPYNDVTAFVLGQWSRMPRFLATPLRLATLLFACSTLLRGGLYHRLRPEIRALVIETWRLSRIGTCRDFMRFYRSLALMALYSREGAAR
jgi:hypothetical protein